MGGDKIISSSKENDENVGGGVGVLSKRRSSSSSAGGLSLQSKSLIPVPVASPKGTPKGDGGENGGVELVEQKARRRPLGSIQNTDSPRRLSNVKENEKVIASNPKVKVTESTPSKKGVLRKSAKNVVATAEAGTGMTTDGGSRLSTGVPNTPHNSPSRKKKSGSRVGVKKDTDGEDSIAYWKALAESRRQALADALTENMELHERVEELKKENAQLEELVDEAKDLAVMVNSVSEDFSLDESGIGDTINVINAE